MTSREDPWAAPREWWRVTLFQSKTRTTGRGLVGLMTAVEDCYLRGWGFKVEFFDDDEICKSVGVPG